VITTPMTFISTNHAILYRNAVPVFCDTNQDMAIDYRYIKRLITKKTKAIMVVHYSGLPVYMMNEIYEIAQDHNLWVIEDAAHACGAFYHDQLPVGCCPYHKSLTCFSFHSVKNLNVGDGGMVTTNNEELAKQMKQLRWLGIDRDTYVRTDTAENKGYNWLYNVESLGYKYHMNDITAVFGLSQINYLVEENIYRRKLVHTYKENLNLSLLYGYVGKDVDQGEESHRISSNHIFVIQVPRRDHLAKKLNDCDIFPGVHYYPNHLYPTYKPYYRRLVSCEESWKTVLSLPLHLGLTEKDVYMVCDAINGGW